MSNNALMYQIAQVVSDTVDQRIQSAELACSYWKGEAEKAREELATRVYVVPADLPGMHAELDGDEALVKKLEEGLITVHLERAQSVIKFVQDALKARAK